MCDDKEEAQEIDSTHIEQTCQKNLQNKQSIIYPFCEEVSSSFVEVLSPICFQFSVQMAFVIWRIFLVKSKSLAVVVTFSPECRDKEKKTKCVKLS